MATVFASPLTRRRLQRIHAGSNSLLICSALKNIEKPDNHLDKKLRKDGYDSVFAPEDTAVRFDEYIVYDRRQIVPEYVVHYRTSKAAIPNVGS